MCKIGNRAALTLSLEVYTHTYAIIVIKHQSNDSGGIHCEKEKLIIYFRGIPK